MVSAAADGACVLPAFYTVLSFIATSVWVLPIPLLPLPLLRPPTSLLVGACFDCVALTDSPGLLSPLTSPADPHHGCGSACRTVAC